MRSLAVLLRVNWWLVLLAAAVCLIGVVFIRSATVDQFQGQHQRQILFLGVSAGCACFVLLVPYGRVQRWAWPVYGMAMLGLLLLPVFGTYINGARRWYVFPGFTVQPSEFAKPALILALASWLRFKSKASTFEGLLVPVLLTAVPAFMVLEQPDLSSSLIYWPILLAMCYAAGTPARTLLIVLGLGMVLAVVSYFLVMESYQQARVDACVQHFSWSEEQVRSDESVREVLRVGGYQPWQALIAIGSGGWTGFGLMVGPQNRYDFLPYRSVDYIFAVVCEEGGLLGAAGLLLLFGLLVWGFLYLAVQVRERFGRLLCVGAATYLGAQALVHVAVNLWLVPATGLPMPLISYGGSSTLAACLALALALNAGAHREPVLAPDGFR